MTSPLRRDHLVDISGDYPRAGSRSDRPERAAACSRPAAPRRGGWCVVPSARYAEWEQPAADQQFRRLSGGVHKNIRARRLSSMIAGADRHQLRRMRDQQTRASCSIHRSARRWQGSESVPSAASPLSVGASRSAGWRTAPRRLRSSSTRAFVAARVAERISRSWLGAGHPVGALPTTPFAAVTYWKTSESTSTPGVNMGSRRYGAPEHDRGSALGHRARMPDLRRKHPRHRMADVLPRRHLGGVQSLRDDLGLTPTPKADLRAGRSAGNRGLPAGSASSPSCFHCRSAPRDVTSIARRWWRVAASSLLAGWLPRAIDRGAAATWRRKVPERMDAPPLGESPHSSLPAIP